MLLFEQIFNKIDLDPSSFKISVQGKMGEGDERSTAKIQNGKGEKIPAHLAIAAAATLSNQRR